MGCLDVAPGLFSTAHGNAPLMPLAEDGHNIARTRLVDRESDGITSIGDAKVPLSFLLGRNARGDLVHDLVRVLVEGILVGDEEEVGVGAGDASQLGALVPVS